MQVLSLRWYAKYGHFLRAEANANALSYPVPPRTAVLGMLGAILGLEKDSLSEVLGDAQVAIGGALPQRFWHRIKLRKDPPTALPLTIKKGQKGSTGSDEKATLILQEWMWKPDFLIHIVMPNDVELFSKLCKRVADRQWYFSPCMGLSELLAKVELIGISEAKHLPYGERKIASIFPQSAGRVLNTDENLGIHLLRMPHSVDSERVFSHQGYYLEHQGRALKVATDQAWKFMVQKEVISVVFC
jgi:CRISPR-associated protein Cas5h